MAGGLDGGRMGAAGPCSCTGGAPRQAPLTHPPRSRRSSTWGCRVGRGWGQEGARKSAADDQGHASLPHYTHAAYRASRALPFHAVPPRLPSPVALLFQAPHQQSLAMSPVHSTSTGLTTTTGFTTGTTTCMGTGRGSGVSGESKRCWRHARRRRSRQASRWVGAAWNRLATAGRRRLLCLPPRSPPGPGARAPRSPFLPQACCSHLAACGCRSPLLQPRECKGSGAGAWTVGTLAVAGGGGLGGARRRPGSPGPLQPGRLHGLQPSREGCGGVAREVGSCEGSPAAARTSRQAVSRLLMVAGAKRDGEECERGKVTGPSDPQTRFQVSAASAGRRSRAASPACRPQAAGAPDQGQTPRRDGIAQTNLVHPANC